MRIFHSDHSCPQRPRFGHILRYVDTKIMNVPVLKYDDDDDVDHVDGARLRLCTAAYCSSLGWYMTMENHNGMISTRKNSWFVYQSSPTTLPPGSPGSEAGETGEVHDKWWIFALRSVFVHTSKGSLTCDMRPTALLPLQRKACYEFFIALGWVWTREPWV
jgi:hypothetical protein